MLNEDTAFVSSSEDGTAFCTWSSEPRKGSAPKYRWRNKKLLFNTPIHVFFWERKYQRTKRGQGIFYLICGTNAGNPDHARQVYRVRSRNRSEHKICYTTLKIKKICFSPKVPIQPRCRPKSDSAPSGAIWAQLRPKQLKLKATPANAKGPFQRLVPIGPDLREPN